VEKQRGYRAVNVLRALPGGRTAAAIVVLSLLLAAPAVTARAASNPCGPPVVNPVACENTNPGNPSSDWDVSGSGDPSIQGFATDISVNRGSTISFKISTNAANYSIGIFRLGYYQGNGARKIASVSPSASLPQNQPACLTNAPTGLIDCGDWAVSASWAVPATAVSGVYLAVLVRSDTGGASQIPFIVRDDSSHSAVLFTTDDTTWQAYNQWGGNSLYLGSAPSSDGRAYKVSYNRPFATRGQSPGYGTSNFLFYGEYPMIRFLEANGYDISYFTHVDLDRSGPLIANHKVMLMSGHDEYWSAAERASVESARAAGVSLAFFTGNEVFWKVRWENSIDGSGTAYRTLVCYKETKSATPIDPQDPPTWTGTWRDPTWSPPADGGRPENAMTGTIFMVNRGTTAIQVPGAFAKLRFWRNTSVASLTPTQTATLASSTLGYEWDEDLDNGSRPAGLFDLSSTTVSVPELLQDFGNTYTSGTVVHNMTLYRASSGALVFGAGTVQWAWGLDVNHDNQPDFGPTTPDVRMQQATINLLADMGAQPATIMAGLVSTTASADSTPPTSVISSPASGATVNPGSPVTVTGTATDFGGGVVAGVEVSADGGASWHAATGSGSWTYTWIPIRPGTATLRSRAVDDSGNLEAPSAGVTVTVGSSASPSFVSQSNVTNGTRVLAPAAEVAGDLLLANLEVDADPANVSGPVGWTKALDVPVANGVGGVYHAQTWYKVAGAGEPSSYTFGVAGSPWVDIGLMDYANVNTVSPLDVIGGRDAGVTTAPQTPSITTTQANERLVAVFMNYGSVSWSAGSGMSKRYDFDSNMAEDGLQASAGASGAKTATASAAGGTAALLTALKPVQTDTQPPTVAITTPGAGATVSGSVAVTATASDNVGVAWVQLQVDGVNLGPHLTSAPYTQSWDSTSVSNGSHNLSAIAADAAGNQASSAQVAVTVANAPPPQISNVSASGITSTGATISWTTDVASSSQVEYGTTLAYGTSTSLDTSQVTSHAQTLSGLQSGTQYHYRVRSQAGGGALGISPDATFSTALPAPPVISNVQASGITSSTATISWSTDTASDSTVQYGTSSSYGQVASTSGLVTSHSQLLSGLSAGTVYHYKVLSKDGFGQTSSSGDQTFTTSTAPPSPPSFRVFTSISNGASVSRPAGVVQGDLLLASLEVDADPVTVTGPAGWTLLVDTPVAQGTAAAYHAQLWYKVATAAEPGSYAWSVPGGIWVDLAVLAYAGASGTSPIDAAAGRDAGSGSTAGSPTISTSQANDLVVAIFIDYNTATWSTASGTSKRFDFDGNTAQDFVQASPAAVNKTATASVSGPLAAMIVAIRGH
jgi:hypothetical protein